MKGKLLDCQLIIFILLCEIFTFLSPKLTLIAKENEESNLKNI